MNNRFTQQIDKIEKALTALIPQSGDTDSAEAPSVLLTEPCSSLLSGGGKRWRPLMMVLSYELAGGTDDTIYQLAPLIEGIHNASLIHDDIEDNSELRRGQPAAHTRYGLDAALNAGSWLYFQALKSIETYPADAQTLLDIYKQSLHTIRRLHEGQALDIHWHKNTAFFPSQKEYTAMIAGKTGALAAFAGYAGMRAAGKSEKDAKNFSEITAVCGIAFQIADDIKNITTGNAGKKRGDDIVEGKKSFPVLLHLEQHPEDKTQITAYFEQAKKEGITSPAVEKTIQMLHSSGAVSAAEEYAHTGIADACNRLHTEYGSSPAADGLIELMSFIEKK